jgi:hypothetical protein
MTDSSIPRSSRKCRGKAEGIVRHPYIYTTEPFQKKEPVRPILEQFQLSERKTKKGVDSLSKVSKMPTPAHKGASTCLMKLCEMFPSGAMFFKN